MRKILIAAALAGALVQAGTASAGCMATVGLGPPPKGIVPGTTWAAELTVLQHGRNALPNAKTARPELTIVNAATGERQTFVARGTKDLEVFVADVVFPTAGTWSYEVFDDFSSWGGKPAPCAQTHGFAAVTVGGSSDGTPAGPAPSEPVAPSASTNGSFPVWQVVGGALAALAVVALSLGALRRRREEVATH